MTSYSVYALCEPTDGEPRYVGLALDPIRRIREHCTKRAMRNAGLLTWLEAVQRKPLVRILEECGDGDEAERWWIAYGRSQGCVGTGATR